MVDTLKVTRTGGLFGCRTPVTPSPAFKQAVEELGSGLPEILEPGARVDAEGVLDDVPAAEDVGGGAEQGLEEAGALVADQGGVGGLGEGPHPVEGEGLVAELVDQPQVLGLLAGVDAAVGDLTDLDGVELAARRDHLDE